MHLRIVERATRPAGVDEPTPQATSSDVMMDAAAHTSDDPTFVVDDSGNVPDTVPAPVETNEAPPFSVEAVIEPTRDGAAEAAMPETSSQPGIPVPTFDLAYAAAAAQEPSDAFSAAEELMEVVDVFFNLESSQSIRTQMQNMFVNIPPEEST